MQAALRWVKRRQRYSVCVCVCAETVAWSHREPAMITDRNYGLHRKHNLLTFSNQRPRLRLKRSVSRGSVSCAFNTAARLTGPGLQGNYYSILILTSAKYDHCDKSDLPWFSTNHRARIRCHFDSDQSADYSNPWRCVVDPITVQLSVHGAEPGPPTEVNGAAFKYQPRCCAFL